MIDAVNSEIQFETDLSSYSGDASNGKFASGFQSQINAEISEMNASNVSLRQYEEAVGGDFRHDTNSSGEVVESRMFSSDLWVSIDTHAGNYQSELDNEELQEEAQRRQEAESGQ